MIAVTNIAPLAERLTAQRDAARADLEARLTAARTCACWLIDHHLRVEAIDLRVGCVARPVIRVAASPRLHVLFRDDAAHGQHWDVRLGRTVLDYRTVKHGCEIRWSEVRS